MRQCKIPVKVATRLLIGRDQLNLIFLGFVGVLAVVYALDFVSTLVFHVLQFPVMVALVWTWVPFGFSWIVLDRVTEGKQHKRIPVSSA